ncbi:MAG: phosphatidate cytidylyltransferase [Melioribacteraceae bacterium]|nr:phosphatidate cytidylyltransferase [Melioribacteraceae bacterium]
MPKNNTAKRILVALVAVPLIIAVCLLGNEFFMTFTLGIGLLAFYEFYSFTQNKKFYPNLFIGLASVGAIILNNYYGFIEFQNLSIIIVFLLLLIELFRNKSSAIANTGASLLGIFYIGLFSASILALRELYSEFTTIYINGGYIIISLLITLWVCDSAAFFLGIKFGKNKLFPRVSPKKSWEGAIAGFVFSIIAMLILNYTILDFIHWSKALILGLIIGIIGQMGDLVESLFKRDANIKDSSALIPGHGGVLDRFDSLLFTAPVVYLYFYYFVK